MQLFLVSLVYFWVYFIAIYVELHTFAKKYFSCKEIDIQEYK